MKITRQIIFVLIISAIFSNCKPPCKGTIDKIDNGVISTEFLNKNPYKTGDVIKLKHSEGKIISFSIERATTNEVNPLCDDCCFAEIKYQLNTTNFTPDYPIFDMKFRISNLDSLNVYMNLFIGNEQFIIPEIFPENSGQNVSLDSVLISEKYYYNVFSISNVNKENGTIYTKILYYNYEDGILKINMSNEEYYEIYE